MTPTPQMWPGLQGLAAENWERLGLSQGGGVLQRDTGPDTIERGPLRDDIGAYWKFDEASGTRVDATGNGNDLNDISGSVTGRLGISRNGAFLSDGAYMRNLVMPALSFAPDDGFTFAGWFKRETDGSAGNVLFTYQQSNGVTSVQYQLVNQQQLGITEPEQFRFFESAGSGTTPTNQLFSVSPSHGLWIFWVAWLDPSDNTLHLSLNSGAASGLFQTSGVSVPVAGPTNFLEIQCSRAFDYDELGFWPFALTAAQRDHLYNSGAGRTLS